MALTPERSALRAVAWFVAASMLAAAEAACGAAPTSPPPPPPDHGAPAVPRDSWVVKAPPLEPPRTDPIPALTAAPTCIVTDATARTYEVGPFGGNSRTSALLVVDGKARALLNGSERMLEIEARAPDGAGYVVYGHFAEHVFLKRSIGVAGDVTPTSARALSVASVTGSQANLRSGDSRFFDAPFKIPADTTEPSFISVERYPVKDVVVACDALALAAQPATLGGALALVETRIGVRATPDGDPRFWYDARVNGGVASLGGAALRVPAPRVPPPPPAPRFDGPAVEVLEKRGPSAHVRFIVDGFHVDGWIDAKHVGKRTSDFVEPKQPAPRARERIAQRSRPVRCKEDVALFFPDGYGQIVRVGTVFAGTTIALLGAETEVRDGLREIAVEGIAPSDPYAGPGLRASASSLADCKG